MVTQALSGTGSCGKCYNHGSCMPQKTGCVCVQVKKAEGDEHRNWWTYRAPANMTLQQLQQLAASKLGAATAAGITAGTATAIAKNGTVLPQVKASSGTQQHSSSHGKPTAAVDPSVMRATMALIQRWILAEVGLASQAQLSKPAVQTMQVQAADGQPETQTGTPVDAAAEPQVTSQVAAAAEAPGVQQEGSVSTQAPNSKNQDPGILVDVQAVTNPGEHCLESATACCTQLATWQ